MSKFCVQCGYQFSERAKRSYCCDKKKLACVLCYEKYCKICHQTRKNDLSNPSCKKCYKSTNAGSFFYDPFCDSFFCSKCVCNLFLPIFRAHMESTSSKNKPSNLIELYCGHKYPFEDIKEYLKEFCINCGDCYQEGRDYVIADNCKLCDVCLKYEGILYENYLNRCINCDNIVKNNTQTFDGLVLCSVCSASQIQMQHFFETQSILSKSRRVPEKQSASKSEIPSQKKPNKKQESNFKSEVLIQKKQSLLNRNPVQKIKIVSPYQISSSQNKVQSQNSQSTTKSSEIKDESSYEIIEELPKLQSVSSSSISLKHQYSVDTSYEDFQINVAKDLKKKIKCSECAGYFDSDAVFERPIEKPLYKSGYWAVVANQNEEKPLVNEFSCKMCYSLSINKSYLGFTNELIRTSAKNYQREKHLSVPKTPKIKSTFLQDKSFGFDTPHKPISPVNPMTENPMKSSMMNTHSVYDRYRSYYNLSDKPKCQVCKTNDYMIQSLDKIRYCMKCYNISKGK